MCFLSFVFFLFISQKRLKFNIPYGRRGRIDKKKENLKYYDPDLFDEAIIREREEISEQIRALEELKQMQ